MPRKNAPLLIALVLLILASLACSTVTGGSANSAEATVEAAQTQAEATFEAAEATVAATRVQDAPGPRAFGDEGLRILGVAQQHDHGVEVGAAPLVGVSQPGVDVGREEERVGQPAPERLEDQIVLYT